MRYANLYPPTLLSHPIFRPRNVMSIVCLTNADSNMWAQNGVTRNPAIRRRHMGHGMQHAMFCMFVRSMQTNNRRRGSRKPSPVVESRGRICSHIYTNHHHLSKRSKGYCMLATSGLQHVGPKRSHLQPDLSWHAARNDLHFLRLYANG